MANSADGSVPLYNLDEIPVLHPREGIVQRVFRDSSTCVSFAELHPHLKPGPHSHPWEQIFMILEGRVKFHVGDQVFDMKEDSFVRVPPNVVHYSEPPRPEDGVALNLDIFSPLRPDYFELTKFQTDDFGTTKAAPLKP